MEQKLVKQFGPMNEANEMEKVLAAAISPRRQFPTCRHRSTPASTTANFRPLVRHVLLVVFRSFEKSFARPVSLAHIYLLVTPVFLIPKQLAFLLSHPW